MSEVAEIAIVAMGSIAGALSAIALERFKSKDEKSQEKDDIRLRFIHEAIKRLNVYEQSGVITKEEKEALLSIYKEKLSTIGMPLSTDNNISSLKNDIITLLDQRLAEINSRMEELIKGIQIPVREEKRVISTENLNEHLEDERKSLEDIKQQILRTLSKLEQATLE